MTTRQRLSTDAIALLAATTKTFRDAWFVLGLSLLSATASAAWSVGDLDTLKQGFVTRISGNYQASEFPWKFLSPADCFTLGVVCYFANPDGPYGYAFFGGGLGLGTRLASTDALVLIMETPPPMRYFGVTPYIYSHFYASLPANPSQSGTVQVFESLTDTVNLLNIKTTGSVKPGAKRFTQLSVFIITADSTTYAKINNEFIALGFPGTAINKIALPINAVPLRMGTVATSDTYAFLMRLAYPYDPSRMTDYIARAPVRVLRLSPSVPRAVMALPAPVSKLPGNGVSEANTPLLAARDQLVDQLVAQYGADYLISEDSLALTQTNNYVCVDIGIVCNVDNSDAIYTRDVNRFVPSTRVDKILTVGVNHVSTGKATYVSHSIINDANHVGVLGVSDTWLNGTALKMAKITSSADPRYATYQQLYAFTISYDCSGELACVTVPEPTAGNPVGVVYGDPLDVSARYYLDPATLTRPSSNEVILQRVFTLTKKQ